MTHHEIMNWLSETIDEMFGDFQDNHNIECGDLSPELEAKLNNAMERVTDVIQMCMTWQKNNCPHSEYEQAYAPDTDTTFIMKNTYAWCDLVRREVVGFYSGKPCEEHMETYKTAGTVAEY